MGKAAIIAFVVLTVVACDRGPDVEEMANDALESAALDDRVDADYDDDAKVVHLTGTVLSAADKTRAQDVVRTSVGVHAQVANAIVVEGRDEATADNLDDGIEDRFDVLIDTTPVLTDYTLDLNVENGVGTLTGEVATAAERAKVEELARAIPGLKDLVNSITVNADRRRPTQ